jgi:ATP-binding cassette ChvD family protein
MNGRQFIYHMQGLTKTFPAGKKVLENIHLSFYPDAKIGVLGVNGSGKSTLLRIMAGIDTEFVGEGFVAEGARVGYLEQEPQLDAKKTVRENVMEGVAAKKAVLDRYNEIATNYSDETADEMAKLQDKIDSQNLWDLDSQVDLAMDALRCPPDDSEVTKLSGGERRRVALCKLLLDQPDLLLLDEPTNHLDAESVNWLEGHLRNYPGAILIVTHDRYFLDNVTGWILELDHGRGIPYEGNYTSWLKQKQKRLEQEGREDESRRRTLERESEWILSSPKARQAKSKARYQRYEDLLKIANAKQNTTAQITIPVAERLGQNVVDFDGLKKGYGDNLLIDDLSFKLPPGGIVGVIGPNGAGKTTLLHVVSGFVTPVTGVVKLDDVDLLGLSPTRRVAFGVRRTFQQEYVVDDLTLWENVLSVADHVSPSRRGAREETARAIDFVGLDRRSQIPGWRANLFERRMTEIAKTLTGRPRVVLLDEPGAGLNEAETDRLRKLLFAIPRAFDLQLVVIDHDADLISSVCTETMVLDFGKRLALGPTRTVLDDPEVRRAYLGNA